MAAREQLLEFHRAHYRPENLIISISGDVSTFSTLVTIQQIFGDFVAPAPAPARDTSRTASPAPPKAAATKAQSATPSSPTQPQAPAQTAPAPGQPALRYASDRLDGTQTVVSVGFRMPGLASKDRAATEVLAALAGQGKGSRLYRALADDRIASRVEASLFAFSDENLFAVQVWPERDLLDKAESTLFREIDRLRRELPTEGEMARAKAVVEKRFIEDTSNYLGRAFTLARAEAAGGGYRAAGVDYRKLVRAITPEDVQRIAARYFTLDNVSVHEAEPSSAPPRSFDSASFAKTVVVWSAGLAQPVEAKSVRPAENAPAAVAQGPVRSDEELAALESLQPLAVKDFSTLNGPRAFVREDRSMPVVTVALLFQGGRVAEDEATAGLTELMLRSALMGTQRRARAQTAHELEQLGAEVEIVCEPDFYGVMVSVLSRNSERALRIVRDLIEEPEFRDDDFELARRAHIEAIREGRQSGYERARELFYQAIYPSHPYSFPSHGREEVVTKLTPDQIREWHTKTIKRQVPIAVIVGDTQGSALVSAVMAEGFRRRELDKSLQLKVPQPGAPTEKAEQRKSAVTHSVIGFVGPRGESANLDAFDLIETVMDAGGLSSEMQGGGIYARASGFEVDAHLTAGAVYFYFATAAENEQRAKARLLTLVEAIASMNAEDMAGAKAVAATWNLFRLQSQKARVLAYAVEAFYQRDPKRVDEFADLISKIMIEDIRKAASDNFKTKAIYSGIVRGSAAR
jgi:zinc protease